MWDERVVRALRCELLAEHLGQDTSELDDHAAMRLYREVAETNRRRAAAHADGRQGLAIALDATDYAR